VHKVPSVEALDRRHRSGTKDRREDGAAGRQVAGAGGSPVRPGRTAGVAAPGGFV